MKKKNRRHAGWKLLLLVLAVLFPASTPAINAEASAMPASGTLTIHDYALEDMDAAGDPNDGNEITSLPEGAKPLAGVEFTVWQVDPAAAATVTSAAQAWADILPATKQTGVTNADGRLTFHLGNGLYYVAETGNTGAEKVVFCEPFLVSVPMADPSGTGWITDVHVYPKNQSLVIDKFVGNAGDADYPFTDYDASKYKPVAMDTAFGWSILSSLPANLGKLDGESYTVTDTLKSTFDYVSGTLKVYAVGAMDTPVGSAYLLSEGSDYTFHFSAGTNTLTVELTDSGIARLGNRYTNHNDRYLLIKYDCQLNSTASHGIRHYSGAEVTYKRNTTDSASMHNSNAQPVAVNLSTTSSTGINTMSMRTASAGAGTSFVASSQVTAEPAVHTGQIGITKLENGTDKVLKGAQFGLAATKADARAGTYLATGTTDEKGMLAFTGLAYGAPGDRPSANTGNTTYWLVELTAPAGYQLLKDPVEVIFHYQQDQETGEYYFAKVDVYNVLTTPAAKDPGTGTTTGAGKTTNVKTGDTSALYLFTAVMLLSLGAIVVVLVYRNKKKASGETK